MSTMEMRWGEEFLINVEAKYISFSPPSPPPGFTGSGRARGKAQTDPLKFPEASVVNIAFCLEYGLVPLCRLCVFIGLPSSKPLWVTSEIQPMCAVMPVTYCISQICSDSSHTQYSHWKIRLLISLYEARTTHHACLKDATENSIP